MKNDQMALNYWHGVYDAIPKSVWAVAAYHLANASCAEVDNRESTLARFKEEIEALRDNQLITAAQARTSLAAIAKAEGK